MASKSTLAILLSVLLLNPASAVIDHDLLPASAQPPKPAKVEPTKRHILHHQGNPSIIVDLEYEKSRQNIQFLEPISTIFAAPPNKSLFLQVCESLDKVSSNSEQGEERWDGVKVCGEKVKSCNASHFVEFFASNCWMKDCETCWNDFLEDSRVAEQERVKRLNDVGSEPEQAIIDLDQSHQEVDQGQQLVKRDPRGGGRGGGGRGGGSRGGGGRSNNRSGRSSSNKRSGSSGKSTNSKSSNSKPSGGKSDSTSNSKSDPKSDKKNDAPPAYSEKDPNPKGGAKPSGSDKKDSKSDNKDSKSDNKDSKSDNKDSKSDNKDSKSSSAAGGSNGKDNKDNKPNPPPAYSPPPPQYGHSYPGGARTPFRASDPSPSGIKPMLMNAAAAGAAGAAGGFVGSSLSHLLFNHGHGGNNNNNNGGNNDNGGNGGNGGNGDAAPINNYYLYPLGDENKAHVNVPAAADATRKEGQESGTGEDEDLPVMCVCAENEGCSCDKFDDPEYVKGIQKDLDKAKSDDGLPKVIDHEGKRTLLVNGTVPSVKPQHQKQKSAGERVAGSKILGLFGMVVVPVMVFMF